MTKSRTINNTPKTWRNPSLLMVTAKYTPIIAPVINGRMMGRINSGVRMPLRLNSQVEVMLCAKIPIRLEPLATLAGRPKTSVRTVKVMVEPLPASVLMMPATNPPSMAMEYSITSTVLLAISTELNQDTTGCFRMNERHMLSQCSNPGMVINKLKAFICQTF